MDVAIEEVSELARKVTVTLPAEDVVKELDKKYNELKKEVAIKGFRRGKAPMSILKKSFKDRVEPEVADKLVKDTYFDVIEEKKIDVIVHPEIHETTFADDGTFTYVAMVEVKPEFELQEYKGLEIEKPNCDVTEVEVETKIAELQRSKAVLRSVEDDHEIVMDDIVTIDFQGFHNEKALKEVRNENFSVDMGTGYLGEDFEERLLGLKKGASILYESDFPADFQNPVMAGKTIEFKVDVKGIKERIKPALDDEFAKDIDEKYETFADLQTATSSELKEEKESALEGDLNDRIMQKLLEMNAFPIPQRLVAFEIQEMIKQTEENLKRAGQTLESAGINKEQLVEHHREAAEKRVRGDFLLKKVAELENITLTDEDLEQGYSRIADEYNMTIENVKGYFKKREELMPFMAELLNEKILNFLRNAVNLVEVAAGAEEDTGAGEEATQDA
ncbi:trigger factor [Candidatus Electrothrix aarhusensis]|jgi:trigger factor|uniref:Trigger factor n=1 Tax=Candidatus Electrothrix aarhusensis TaxID=1859131 RepID=A0A3S3R3R4_9BACT|nr:trigger factor [Candidatus Electrothrix aarhusensis]